MPLDTDFSFMDEVGLDADGRELDPTAAARDCTLPTNSSGAAATFPRADDSI